MSDYWYYNFLNPDHKVKLDLLKGHGVDLRYIYDIVDTRISMWMYEGLPEDLTSEIVETALMFRNHLCMVKVPGLGNKVVLGYYTFSGKMNLYYKPETVNVNTLSGNRFLGRYKFSDLVLVKDSPMDFIPWLSVYEYLNKIIELEKDLFILCDHATLPLVLVGGPKQAKALREQAQKFGHKNSFIVGDNMSAQNVSSYDIKLTINPLDIYDLKKKYLNECMSSLGIYSVEEKRERIVTQELVNQNDYTDFIYSKCNNSRKLWVEESNKRLGTNIKLIESYERNYNETVDEEARKEYAISKATAKGEKDGNPEGSTSRTINPNSN